MKMYCLTNRIKAVQIFANESVEGTKILVNFRIRTLVSSVICLEWKVLQCLLGKRFGRVEKNMVTSIRMVDSIYIWT